MKSPSQTALQDELKRLKLDVAAHHRQRDGLYSSDLDMTRLLKAEESVLSGEIARVEEELKTPKQ